MSQMIKKIIHKSIKLNDNTSNDMKLSIDTRCYTKSKFIDECGISSDLCWCHIIKIIEFPYVLVVTPSLNAYPTTWKTIKSAREAFKNGEVIQKRFQISDDKQSYVFTNCKTGLYELKMPIICGESIDSLSKLRSIYDLTPIARNFHLGIQSHSTTCLPTSRYESIKAHSLYKLIRQEDPIIVGKPRKLSKAELDLAIIVRVRDLVNEYGTKVRSVVINNKKGKPTVLKLSKDCEQYPDGTKLDKSTIKVVELSNGTFEAIGEPLVSKPIIRNSIEHICTFKKPVKGPKSQIASKSHILKINISKRTFSEFSFGEEPYEFKNILDYVYLFKVPEYPKVLLITKQFNIRATIWDTVAEAQEDLANYRIYQHRVDAGELGVTYVISPYEELSEFPYRIPTLEYIGPNIKEANRRVRPVRPKRDPFIEDVKVNKPLHFSNVRGAAAKRIGLMSEKEKHDLRESINRGRSILETEDQLNMYLYSYGNMHEKKLSYAFKKMKRLFFLPRQKDIDIIDYGCGQGIASICFKDYLESTGRELSIENITLIEPSRKALDRASKLCSLFYPKSNVIEINKDFDSLTTSDLRQNNRCTLHLLSNITDLDFDIYSLARKINRNLKGENWFVIVSPYFFNDLDDQMDELVDSLSADQYYFDDLDKDEFECYECTCRVSLLKCTKR